MRPHDLALGSPGAGPVAQVEVVQPLGSGRLVHLRLGAAPLVVLDRGDAPLAAGERVGLRVDPAALHAFDAESGARLPDRAATPSPSASGSST